MKMILLPGTVGKVGEPQRAAAAVQSDQLCHTVETEPIFEFAAYLVRGRQPASRRACLNQPRSIADGGANPGCWRDAPRREDSHTLSSCPRCLGAHVIGAGILQIGGYIEPGGAVLPGGMSNTPGQCARHPARSTFWRPAVVDCRVVLMNSDPAAHADFSSVTIILSHWGQENKLCLPRADAHPQPRWHLSSSREGAGRLHTGEGPA